MGPGIVIPILIVGIAVPLVFIWARRRFKEGNLDEDDRQASAPAALLTSHALRALASPPWRVVYEVPADRLGGVEHVLIGPPGVFAVTTSMEALPTAPTEDADAHALARAAIVRGGLDDALRRCAMASDRLVTVYWGTPPAGAPAAVDVMAGVTAVVGRRLEEWSGSLPGTMTPAQVDLAWQTVTTAIGRPDPLS